MQSNLEIAQYILDELHKAGIQDAQCTVTQGKTDELNVDSGNFSLMRSLFNSSVSIKVIAQGKKGVAITNRLDKEALDKAVQDAISSANSAIADASEFIAPFAGEQEFESGELTGDKDKLFQRMEEFMADTKTSFPKILMEQFIATYTYSDMLLANTNGTRLARRRGGYHFNTMFSAHEGDVSSSFNGYSAQFDNLNAPFMEAGLVRRLLGESEDSLQTTPVEGKFVGTLLVTPAAMEDILFPVLANCVTDGVLIDGTSPWKDKLGKVVASDSLTVSSVPLHPQIIGGERFTGDGYISENYDIIRDGVLQSFALSQYGAHKTGLERAKNSSFALSMAPGGKRYDELVQGVERGILLNRFSGGAPSPNGDFSGVAKNSFLIENGRIAGALSETMISGNLLHMLQNIEGISKERISEGSAILPWAAFGGVTISGK